MEGAPISDIVVSKGSVSNDITGEEGSGSGLGDVGDEVFADVDIAYKGATVIKQFRLGKEQFGGDGVRIDLGQISIYFRIYHTFLVISEKVGQTFLSTISQSLRDVSLLQHMKEIRRCI